ncbi:MAG TPA: TonB-dependent receptor [Gammaproteobacteria bacterium]
MRCRWPIAFTLAAAGAQGQVVDTVEVIGTTPLGGGLDADRVAANVRRATAEDIERQGALDLADFMDRTLGSVFVNHAQNNPLQPDLQYRGFVGSPLLGLPQGIAVYQDGVRINEPFGDTVSWALIPESAIASMALQPGSNPLFGLNALGGAIAIETKDGRTHPGAGLELSAGAFGRREAQAEAGGTAGESLHWFVTGSYLEEDGWRDFSPTEATQAFAKLGWEAAGTAFDASLTYADTDLIGNGAAPADLLELDREAIFTRPDQTLNDLVLLTLRGSRPVGRWEVTGNVYYRSSDIDTYNGDDSDFEACEDDPALICEEEDDEETVVLDPLGNPVPAREELEGATVNRTRTEQDGAGLALQAAWGGSGAHRLLVGFTHDSSDVAFAASTELGALDATRLAVPGGVLVGESFTRLDARTANTSLFITDTVSLGDDVALTLSARYNRTEVTLHDLLGTALDGDHDFDSFNPAVGVTFRLAPNVDLYASYAESNRAPSPVELTCADEDDPCRLPNAFVADPPLEQVVASTYEAGLRGRFGADGRDGTWHAGVFRARNEDDILFISAGALTNEGYFDNVGTTRRQGIELDVAASAERWSWFASYTFLDATFEEAFAAASPNNPAAVDGEIEVQPGDRLPLVPRHVFKGGLRYEATPKLSVGGEVVASSSRHLRGDEGNDVEEIDGYAVLNVRGEYRLSDRVRLFALIDNVLDAEYETFGLFGEADEVLGEEFEDPRFLGPGAPRAAWLGVKVRF